MTRELQHLARLLREVAAAEVLPRWHASRGARKADGSLVTATDIAVQERIAVALARDFPGIALLGEEMTQPDQERLLTSREGPLWVLDPLDGTSNYANGFPFFAISLALIEHGETRLGLVLDPVRDECFAAAPEGIATLNGAQIRPTPEPHTLGDSLAMMDLKRLPPQTLPGLFRAGGFGSQRNLGAVALEWCWLACGRFQLYLHGGQKLWDYAAGRLIAREAGVAFKLFGPGGTMIEDGLSLQPRLAAAAASQGLLDAWLDFVKLPLGEP
jgi:myo-inositol-1(or 4)-monophosphatase